MPRLIIAVSGLTGSGKTTLGDRVGEKLGIRHIWMTHKVFVHKSKVVEFTKNATANFEKSFDKKILGEAKKQDCVVTTWLGPWLIKDASVRVWLYADVNSRIRRKAKEMRITLKEAKKYVDEKDRVNKIRFKNIYGINLDEHGQFDMLLNTSRLNVDQCADAVIFLTQEKTKKRFT